MNKLTIFTPTYNRETELERCYNSLLKQTNKKFEWLIIDDGSIDNTNNLVLSWIEENKINIRYIKKENGGKHTAFNIAVKETKTEYILVTLDSDDTLIENAVETIYKKINELNEEKVGIVFTRKVNEDIEKNNKYNIKILKDHSLKWALENNQFDAECTFIFKTEYIKKFLYPEIKEEKFFTEAYIYYQMDKPMLWSEEKICFCEYQEDGLTKNILSLYYKNPKSWYVYNKLRMIVNKSLIKKIKYAIGYVTFGLLAKEKIFQNDISINYKMLILSVFILGIIGKKYLEIKVKKTGV